MSGLSNGFTAKHNNYRKPGERIVCFLYEPMFVRIMLLTVENSAYARRMGREKVCSVCRSPVLADLQEARRHGKTLRQLETISGLSRAALSRHFSGCERDERLEQHKDRQNDGAKLNPYNHRMWVRLPDGETRLVTDARPSPWWRKKPETILDVRLHVEFEPLDPRQFANPAALCTPELIAEAYAEDARRFPKLPEPAPE